MGVENAEVPVDTAEYLDSDPDIENPKDDPTSSPDCSGGNTGRVCARGPLGGSPEPEAGAAP